MNATLQLLFSMPFTRRIVEAADLPDTETCKLARAYQSIARHALNGTPISKRELRAVRDTLATSASMATYGQQDASEALLVLLDSMNDCVKSASDHSFYVATSRTNFSNGQPDHSIAEQNFILNLPIRDGEKKLTRLEDAVEKFAKRVLNEERIPNQPSIKSWNESHKLKTLPPYLIIAIKRFDERSEKIYDPMSIPLNLDMQPYTVSGKQAYSLPDLYQLKAAIVHSGNAESGHYLAIVRRGDKWFECNDSTITNLRMSRSASNPQFADIYSGGADPYVLLYEHTTPHAAMPEKPVSAQSGDPITRYADERYKQYGIPKPS